MTFAYTIDKQTVFGDQEVAMGTFTNSDGGTGGDIITGLKRITNVTLQHTGAAVVASAPVVNETMPCDGTVTIVTVANAAGIWIAYGSR